ncbi:hypothetical protein ACTMU2_14065 [Cupriavidus basilensis]
MVQADSSLGHYDLPSQSFPVKGLPLGQGEYLHFYGANYRLAITNGPDFRQLKVADEARARAMEAIVTNGPPGSVIRNEYPTKAEMFLYAQAADKSTRVIQFQLVQLKLKDETATWSARSSNAVRNRVHKAQPLPSTRRVGAGERLRG